jgi:hypothetical protein
MFFAFSNEQLNEGMAKHPLTEGDKYVSIGAGGFMAKSKVDTFLNGSEQINKWYKAAIKSNKARKANILYELCNHEAFYTNSLNDTLAALGVNYTRSEVLEVFNANRKKQQADL